MKQKKLKLLTEILAILVICLISFVGVYKQNTNKMENQVKEYKFGKDLTGYRELVFEVSKATQVVNSEGKVIGNTDNYTDENIESYSYQKTETKINPDEELKIENYKKSKSIIENRLKKFGVQDYDIGLNTEDGTISLQIPEDSSTDHTASNILQVADFKIKDSKDESKVYITNEHLDKISAMYNTTETGTTVYLQIKLNKEGQNILKDISSGEYKTNPETSENETQGENTTETENVENDTEDENAVEAEAEITSNGATINTTPANSEGETAEQEENENTSNEEETEEDTSSEEEEQNEITLSIDDNDLITTSFDDPIEDGIISLSMGQASTDAETITNSLESTSTIALIVNSGKLPLTYKVVTNRYVGTDISEEILQKTIIAIAIIIALSIVFLIVKYHLKGLIAGIAFIGFTALDLLLIRYTNLAVTLETIVATIIVLGINYLLTYRLLKMSSEDKKLSKEEFSTEMKTCIIKLIPIFIISIVFVFVKWTKISTFGMSIFWGIILNVIYSSLLTRDMLD